MATVYNFLPTARELYDDLQTREDHAESQRYKRFVAVRVIQRMVRGYLIRKHVAWLAYNAIVIQCAWRKYCARKAFRVALKQAVKRMNHVFYAKNATKIQALWRGYWSRKVNFDYSSYRRWLRTVTEKGERRAAEAAEFTIRSRIDDLRILEDEARQWLAFVAFKLHHLLRTYTLAGIYSDKGTNELSQFEKLLASIRYTDYMKRLKAKYAQFVRKHKPEFANKRLFPIIGDGQDYWYLTLPEMYQITNPKPIIEEDRRRTCERHRALHHGEIHKEPFLWRNVKPPCHYEGRGPFKVERKSTPKWTPPPTPAPTPNQAGDSAPHKDPRFDLYVRHYRPQPDLMKYVDYHINCVVKRRQSIQNVHLANEKHVVCKPKNFPTRLSP